MSNEPQVPKSIANHSMRKEIDTRLLRGDSLKSIDDWLRALGKPSSRATLRKYKDWLEYHADTQILEIATTDQLSMARAEGMGAAHVNEVAFLNDVINMGANATSEGIDEATKIKLGMQAIGIKEGLLSKREDLQDKRRIELLEQLLLKMVEGGLNDMLVGLKAEVLEEQRKQKEKDDAIEAEYTVKESGVDTPVGVDEHDTE